VDGAMFELAKKLVPTLATASVDTFTAALAAADFPMNKAGVIEWWKCTQPQRVELVKLVAAGAQQAKCKIVLENFCKELTGEQGAEAARKFTTAEFDRSGWLQYFLKEAAKAVSEVSADAGMKALVIDIVNGFYYRVSGELKLKRNYDSVDDGVFKSLLALLLSIGFERVPATKEHMLAGDSSSAMIMSHMRWAAPDTDGDVTTPDGSVKRIPVEFKWRCDSRDYATIKSGNGFSTKASSQGYAKAKNLLASWHPFSDEGFRSYLWFRKGQTDNCLYSVVSVGKGEWKAFAVYPKIALSGGTAAKLGGYLGTRKVRCRTLKGDKTEVDLAVSETYLYLFLQVGTVFDTGSAQGSNAYPEVGMSGIPMRNVFGAVRFVRYHLGDPATVSDEAGVAVVVDRAGSVKNDDDARSIEASCGQELYVKAQELYNAVMNSPPTRVAWAATGFTDHQLSAPFKHGSQDLTLDGALTA
jgi:hypothetical protein